MSNKIEKILVLRYRFIGDTLLTIPFLRNLRHNYPDAQIDMLVAPNSGEILNNCPYIDNLIFFDTTKKYRYENSKEKKKTFWNYVKLLRKNKYNKAYVLKRSLSSAVLAFFAGIKERIGFDTENRGFLLTKKVEYKENQHEIECFLDCLRADNLEIKDNYLEEWIGETEESTIENFIISHNLQNTKKIIVHATTGDKIKEWRKDYFAKVIEHISNNLHAQTIFLGAKSDKEVYNEILAKIEPPLNITPLNLCGEFNLCESLAFIAKSDLIVGCDTGNLHMAAAVNTPVIAIFGPMNSIKWRPFNNNAEVLKSNRECMPCELQDNCKYNKACLEDIKPELVIEHINRIIGG